MSEASALVAALDPHIEADREDEQLGLFAPPQTEAGRVRAPSAGRAGLGRPAGVPNRRTARTVDFILSRHRDPRVVLAEMAEANVFDLAALLGCKPYEAYQEKRLAATALLPYLAARITPEVIDNRQVINLTIGAGSAGGGLAGGGQVLEVLTAEDVSAAIDDGSTG